MSKVTLTTVSGTGSIQTFANNINNNSQAIEEAFDNTLSRDGTSPNEMNANLDMNSYRILNLSDAVSNSEPVTLSQVSDVIESAISSDPERFRGPQGIQGIQGIKGDSGAIALTLTRNQIPDQSIPFNAFIVSGFYSVGDLGTGAVYVKGTSSGPMAIQDAAGTWFELAPSQHQMLGYWGAKGDGSTDDRSATLAAVSDLEDNKPLYVGPAHYVATGDPQAGGATVLEFGAKITGGGFKIAQKTLYGSSIDATSFAPGNSSYLFKPDSIHHAVNYTGSTDSDKKNTYSIMRYYDGKGTGSKNVTGHNLYLYSEYGANSTEDSPADGTTSLVDGHMQIYRSGRPHGTPLGAAGAGGTSPIVVVLTGSSNATGGTEANAGPWFTDSNVKIYKSFANVFATADFQNNDYDSKKNITGPTYNFFGHSNNAGIAFCRRLRRETGRTVYLIQCGEGGAAINLWVGSGTSSRLYAANKADIEAALALLGKSTIDYYIYQGGENEGGSVSSFGTNLQTLLTQLRAESWWSATGTYFIAGEPSPQWTDASAVTLKTQVNTITSDGSAYTLVADTAQLTSSDGTGPYLSGESLYILGYYKYFEAICAHTTSEFTPVATAAVPRYTGDYGNHRLNSFYYDLNVFGPKADHRANRECYLAGPTIFVAKYAPGNDIGDGYQGSYGTSIYTHPWNGGFNGQDRSGWVSHPLRAGIAIGGWSGVAGTHNNGTDSGATASFENAILLGDTGGSVWAPFGTTSKMGGLLKGLNHTTHGIYLGARHTHAMSSMIPAFATDEEAGCFILNGYTPQTAPSLVLADLRKPVWTPTVLSFSYNQVNGVPTKRFAWNVDDGADKVYVSTTLDGGGSQLFPLYFELSAPTNSIVVGASNVTVRAPKMTSVPTSAGASGVVYVDVNGFLKLSP